MIKKRDNKILKNLKFYTIDGIVIDIEYTNIRDFQNKFNKLIEDKEYTIYQKEFKPTHYHVFKSRIKNKSINKIEILSLYLQTRELQALISFASLDRTQKAKSLYNNNFNGNWVLNRDNMVSEFINGDKTLYDEYTTKDKLPKTHTFNYEIYKQ